MERRKRVIKNQPFFGGDGNSTAVTAAIALHLDDIKPLAAICTAYFLQHDIFCSNSKTCLALNCFGNPYAWGDRPEGTDLQVVKPFLQTGVEKIYSTCGAYLACLMDMSLIAWGNKKYGACIPDKIKNVRTSAIETIVSSPTGFMVVMKNGTIHSWGSFLYTMPPENTSSHGGIKSVGPWGDIFYVVFNDNTLHRVGYLRGIEPVDIKVEDPILSVVAKSGAFAVVTCNYAVTAELSGRGMSAITRKPNVKTAYATQDGIVCVQQDGSIIADKLPYFPGDTKAIQDKLTDVEEIVSTEGAVCLKKKNGTLFVWGSSAFGGDNKFVQQLLAAEQVEKIVATVSAFAVLTKTGRVFAWGDSENGGDCQSVQANLDSTVVVDIIATRHAFAARSTDVRIFAWGWRLFGGDTIRS